MFIKLSFDQGPLIKIGYKVIKRYYIKKTLGVVIDVARCVKS